MVKGIEQKLFYPTAKEFKILDDPSVSKKNISNKPNDKKLNINESFRNIQRNWVCSKNM